MARDVMGLPIQLVAGYKGTADIRLAFNNGEILGVTNSWQSTRSTWRNELDSGMLNILVQLSIRSHAELTKYPLGVRLWMAGRAAHRRVGSLLRYRRFAWLIKRDMIRSEAGDG